MFERGKKDKSDVGGLDALNSESKSDFTDQKSTSYTPGSKTTTRSGVAVIGRSIRIDGDLRGEEDLRIEGDVNGTIQLRNNTLTIGSEGKISANVYAKSVTVDGSMQGDVVGSECVSIRNNAQVNGNITAPRVSIEDGAKFKGSIEMDPAAVEAALGLQPNAAKNQKAVDATVNIASRPNIRVSKPDTAKTKGQA